MAKVGVIGAGAVGSAALLSLVLRGFAREIVVWNRNGKRAAGVVADLRYECATPPGRDTCSRFSTTLCP